MLHFGKQQVNGQAPLNFMLLMHCIARNRSHTREPFSWACDLAVSVYWVGHAIAAGTAKALSAALSCASRPDLVWPTFWRRSGMKLRTRTKRKIQRDLPKGSLSTLSEYDEASRSTDWKYGSSEEWFR
jgi:hypothetical protein